MPKQDTHHNAVRHCLLKDGWTITDDPFRLDYKGTRLFADLAAERPFAAEKGQQKIVVEIKVFTTPSPMTDLEKAVGQYGIYRTFLRKLGIDRELYLAIAHDLYNDFFLKPAVQDIVTDHQISLLVFDSTIEKVVTWIKN